MNWVEIESEEYGFRASFPGLPKEDVHFFTIPGVSSRSWSAKNSDGLAASICVSTLRGSVANFLDNDSAVEKNTDSMVESMTGGNRFISSQVDEFAGHKARIVDAIVPYSHESRDFRAVRFCIFWFGTLNYIVISEMPSPQIGPFNFKAAFDKFFGSFELIRTLSDEEARALAQKRAGLPPQGSDRDALLRWARGRIETAASRVAAWTCENEECGWIAYVSPNTDIDLGGSDCLICGKKLPESQSGEPELTIEDFAEDICRVVGMGGDPWTLCREAMAKYKIGAPNESN